MSAQGTNLLGTTILEKAEITHLYTEPAWFMVKLNVNIIKCVLCMYVKRRHPETFTDKYLEGLLMLAILVNASQKLAHFGELFNPLPNKIS